MSSLLICHFAQMGAAVLLSGAAILRLLAWGTGINHAARWNGLTLVSWCVLLLAGVFDFWLTAAEMSGLPFAQMFSSEGLGSVLRDTDFGRIWSVRVALLAGLFVLRLCTGTAQQAAILDMVNALLTTALLATLVWGGHAHASDKQAWLLPMNLLHVVAAGAWPGGLLPLWLLLAHARREPTLLASAVTITRRFSRLSIVAVGVLAFSGLLSSYGLVGTFTALWPDVYGRLLLCKVALFTGMIAFGGVNRCTVRQPKFEDSPEILRCLCRNVAGECALAILTLLAAEALAMNAPPASAMGKPAKRPPVAHLTSLAV